MTQEQIKIQTDRLMFKAKLLIEERTDFQGTVVCSVLLGYKSTEKSTPRIGMIATLTDDLAYFIPYFADENYIEKVGKDASWTTDIDWSLIQ